MEDSSGHHGFELPRIDVIADRIFEQIDRVLSAGAGILSEAQLGPHERSQSLRQFGQMKPIGMILAGTSSDV